MKYFLLISLFSFLHSISAQSYSYCYPYYYYSSYYYFYNNGAYCCYKYSYRSSYISSYYAYCPYYTTATTVPATTSLSNCNSYYYYSYYYPSSCCYRNVTAYNAYYSNNYYYTTRDCNLTTTTTPAPASCYYYYYSSYYGIKCCNFYDYSSYSGNYDQYCPTANTLASKCGTSCCTAYTPVYNGYETFYYPQYFCPSENVEGSYCGPFCGMAIVFGLVGSCCCICGLSFTIAFFVLFGLLMNGTFKKHGNKSSYIVEHQLPPELSSEVQDERQEWEQQEYPPPQLHGYTYAPSPLNVPDTVPYPPLVTGVTDSTQVICNPTAVPTYSQADEQLKTKD